MLLARVHGNRLAPDGERNCFAVAMVNLRHDAARREFASSLESTNDTPSKSRLKHALGMSYRRISAATGVGKTQAADYVHLAGEKLFVDWAGDTIAVVAPASGAERREFIFVAALGASNFTYAEARWSEMLSDWIAAHVHAFAAIGGVPRGAGARQSQGRHHQAVAL